jgi:hypothetical protein
MRESKKSDTMTGSPKGALKGLSGRIPIFPVKGKTPVVKNSPHR